MVYLYDGTFEGFLTAIHDYYYIVKAEKIYSIARYQTNIIDKVKQIETDKSKWEKVINAIKNKFTIESQNNINYAFLSGDDDKDTYLLNYIVFGFKVGTKLDDYHTHPSVHPIHKLSKRVGFETHRFLGLLRFSEVSDSLYSCIEPDNDIITLLIDHFADRLKNEKFIIHDKRRKKAVVYIDNNWFITEFPDMDIPVSEKEQYFRKLWKGYFKGIAIEERKNLLLQQHFGPKKYRKNLTEFK